MTKDLQLQIKCKFKQKNVKNLLQDCLSSIQEGYQVQPGVLTAYEVYLKNSCLHSKNATFDPESQLSKPIRSLKGQNLSGMHTKMFDLVIPLKEKLLGSQFSAEETLTSASTIPHLRTLCLERNTSKMFGFCFISSMSVSISYFVFHPFVSNLILISCQTRLGHLMITIIIIYRQ